MKGAFIFFGGVSLIAAFLVSAFTMFAAGMSDAARSSTMDVIRPTLVSCSVAGLFGLAMILFAYFRL